MDDSKIEESYQKALDELEHATTFGIDPSLDGIRDMAALMGDPQKSYVSLQVGGTNGKSSTVRFMAAMLKEAGFKVGLYTSPELVEYPERFEVDGKVISHEKFAHIIHKAVEVANSLAPRVITEFEILTAAAFLLFKEEQVDFAVLEVGMGGRWDSTTLVNPSVATICGVGLDHMKILGDTIEEIAGEKAGIIKPGTAVVLGPNCASTQQVFYAKCDECGVHPSVVEEEGSDAFPTAPKGLVTTFKIKAVSPKLVIDVKTPLASYDDVAMEAPEYQAQNIATAIVATEAGLGRALDADKVRKVFSKVMVPGRFETLSRDPLLIIDAAHNPQGAEVFAEAIHNRFADGPKPTLLLAILADKDSAGIVKQLADAVGDIVVTKTDSPRAMSVDDLAALVTKLSGKVPEKFDTPAVALRSLRSRKNPPSVVAAGSITLAGTVKGWFCGIGSHAND